jgi:pimeloyl-ACP methyl ester carboxylesterase
MQLVCDQPAIPRKEATMKEAGRSISTGKMIRADGIELATETFGNPSDPPLLLIMGMMASMLWWPDEFCRMLAANDRCVIRYDHRDTGLSTTWEPGKPGYTSDDMVDDAARILDGYGLSAAHVAGMSMGGAIAQLMALRYPGRVLSLTAISTSPVGMDTAHLPGATQAYQEHSARGDEVDWSNREATIRYMVEDMRALASPTHPFDETAAREFVERDYDRATRFASAANHYALKEGKARSDRLSDLRAPLLVIHGTADPLIPVEHGAALADAVAGARLVRLEGGGHELNEAHWPEIVAEIIVLTGQKT